METETPTATAEYTNQCTCLKYDEMGNVMEGETPRYCYDTCWEYVLDDFAMVTEELRNSNETNWWKVDNLRLWNGEVSGYFQAKTVEDILQGMTVRGEWTLHCKMFGDRIEYSLSHHDSPTGSASTLRCVSDEEREEKGLY